MGYNNSSNQSGSMYQRSSSSTQGTVVPGMHEQAPGVETAAKQEIKEPCVGFLYSISRQGVGEYWPLHLGRNTIGRDEECDVVLHEKTVSGLHAALNVKVMKSSHKLVAQIRDEGSKNGLTVNDEELDFGVHECHDKDLIRVGDNYVLLLILIDTDAYGLTVSQEFQASDEGPAMPEVPGGFNDFNLYDSSNRAAGGTQAMDGGADFQSGGTKFL